MSAPPRLTGWKLRLSKCFLIPQRVIMTIMASFAIVNAYTMRICLSVAITEMVNVVKKADKLDENACHYDDEPVVVDASTSGKKFTWSSDREGYVLGSFYYGYIVSHLPGGNLAEYYGGKHVLGWGILWTAILTLLTPIVTVNFDYYGLIVVRVAMGLGEGVTFPALNVLLAEWIPENEKARLGTLAFAGVVFGTIIGTSLSGYLILFTGRWESCFYVFGAAAIVWYVFWQLLCYSSPDTHPFISDAEYEFLKENIHKQSYIKLKDIPWCGILNNVPLWALIIGQIGSDWALYTMVNNLPIYMKSILKFAIDKNGLLSSLPYVLMWITSMLSAVLADWLLAKDKLRVVTVRKMFGTVSNLGPAVFILLAGYGGCNRPIAIVCFCLGMGFFGCYYPGMRVNALDLSRPYSGTLMALVNGLGTLSGMFSSPLIGLLTPNNTLSEWRLVYWICFGVLTTSAVVFAIWASGDSQKFNEPDYVWPGCCKKSRAESPK